MSYAVFDKAIRDYDGYIKKELGLTDPQYGIIWRSAIWGNGGEESTGFTEMHQVHGHARGGWQWDDRRAAYEAFCSQNNVDPDSVYGSVWYLVHELQTTENHQLVQLKKTTTLEAATYTFMKLFERPGVEAEPVRLRWAEHALSTITAMEKDVTDLVTPTTVTTQVDPVDQLAVFIKSAELKVEDVIRALLIAKGVPAFIIDFVFSQVNQIDLAGMIRHIDLNALLASVFQKK